MIASANALDPVSQCFQWPNDSPGNKQRGNKRHAKTQEQETGSSKQGRIQWAIDFFDRLLNEYRPAEYRDRRPGAKNSPTPEIRRYGPRQAFCAGSGLQSRTHLIEVRYVAALQDEANVWVRDEIAVMRYGISVTFGSDFQLRYQIPDIL